MSDNENQQNRPRRKTRQVRGGIIKRAISGNMNVPNLYSKRMQVYAYSATTTILTALLIGVGYLYKTDKVQSTDSILMFILAQVLGAWVALTNKIFRITTINSDKTHE